MQPKTEDSDLNLRTYYRSKNRDEFDHLSQKASELKDITIAIGSFLDKDNAESIDPAKSQFSTSNQILSNIQIQVYLDSFYFVVY